MPKFFGEYKYNIDNKGRLVMPPKYRDFLKGNIYLLKGFEKCLLVVDELEIKKLEEKISFNSLTDKDIRSFSRAFFSGVNEIKPDSQGRILIPKNLLEYGEIKEEAIIVGTGFYIEIWNKENWIDESEKLDQIRNSFFDLAKEEKNGTY